MSAIKLRQYAISTCLALAVSTPAAAAVSWEWHFDSGSNSSCTNSGACPWDATRAPSSYTGPSVTASGLANTGGSNPNTNATTGYLQSAYVPSWGTNGLGVINRDAYTVNNNGTATDGGTVDDIEGHTNEHSMDSNDRYEAIMFSFANPIVLTDVEIGWHYTDSDITVLAYTGTGTPTFDTSSTWGSLTGWEWVGNYSNLSDDTKQAVNDGTNTGGTPVSSGYWIIGAYNPAYSNGDNWSAGNDYVKLLALYGTKPPDHKAPEPSSALLLGCAVVGLWRFRAKRGSTT